MRLLRDIDVISKCKNKKFALRFIHISITVFKQKSVLTSSGNSSSQLFSSF